MKRTPHVSVCIPVRNGAAELHHTLSNLFVSNAYPKEAFEVVLGDHGSSDATSRILADWRSAYPALAVVEVPYESANRALVRNRVARNARGEILVFIDHDVLISPQLLGEHDHLHREYAGAVVTGQTYGKGVHQQPIASLLPLLDLDDIGASYAEIESRSDFSDFRSTTLLHSKAPLVDLRQEMVPPRFCWTCNLSVRRTDFVECGGFDEGYEGWGLEDHDLAHEFYRRGAPLLFSKAAWAFHIPHPVDTWANIVSWRRNFARLFAKFPIRELEYFGVYRNEVEAGARRSAGMLNLLSAVDLGPLLRSLARRLPLRQGRRFAHFVTGAEMAEALDLTDSLEPFGSLQSGAETRGGVEVWPLFGLCTPFPDRKFDEAIVLVDVLMRLDRTRLAALLVETARLARHVIVCRGLAPREETLQPAAAAFDQMFDSIRFASVERIDASTDELEARHFRLQSG